ncbi:MAG TPA: ribosome small subunit-dependent GTPase A [Mollicutes bacterium]|jgi:ribosome biogenesis GTPase|nr:ribosome small subunit-dependent GTPase A [Mollicutes bacterium]
MVGQIIRNISNLYTVKYENNYIECNARGKFKNKNLKPLVGDKVIFDKEKKLITELLPRKNELLRPPICNVDQALIVISVKEPNLDKYLLDKMISIISNEGINIIICFTKLDLLEGLKKDEINEYIKYYKQIGYDVVTNNQTEELHRLLKNKITVLAGQSGVGKSSLLNMLDNTLNLKTNVISHALGRGKHTTRHVELLEIKDSLVADTPGFSSLNFHSMKKEEIRDSMPEFEKNKDGCKYRDCFHLKEDDCKIKELVKNGEILDSRYANYQKFLKEKDDENDQNININFNKK